MIIEILQNAALLCIASVGLFWIFKDRQLEHSITGGVYLGVVYGLTTFLVTATPISLPDGATIDARAGPVIIAGLLGGPLPAAIAAAFGALARYFVGGSFAFSGVLVFSLYAVVGTLIWRRWNTTLLGPEFGLRRIGLGALLSVGCAALMFFFISPDAVAQAWIVRDFPWIALANSVSILLSALFAAVAVQAARQSLALAQTAKSLELAKRAGGIGVWIYDVKTGITTWDDTNKKLHGIPIEVDAGTIEDWEQTVHPDDLARVKFEFRSALEGREVFDSEYRVLTDGGAVRTLKGDAIVERDPQGVPLRVVGTNFDLTPFLEKESELRETRSIAAQAQKLDTIGKLTGGVAHDFNNLLAVIQGNLEFLLENETKQYLPKSERLDILTSAISAARRGGELTRSMLAFARKSYLEPQYVKINEVVRETENWIARAIPSSIVIDTSLQHNVWPLHLDLASLQSAIVNVIINSRDAMPKGGKLTIETANIRIDQDYIGMLDEVVDEGRYVMLAITDTGNGVDPRILPDVFEPFVTTKDLASGSGLGLSMVQGFARQSEGFVKIYSEPGVGTCVKMFFPAGDPADVPEDTARTERTHDNDTDARARILIAEDQLEVLAVIVRVLKAEGYDVTAATRGDEAYELFKNSGPFDLLLTDVVMPGPLRGPDLARECRAINPNLPVIFMSGYASEATVHGNGLQPDDIRLMKPVPRAELLQRIRESLEKAESKKS